MVAFLFIVLNVCKALLLMSQPTTTSEVNPAEFDILSCSHSGISAPSLSPVSIKFNQPLDTSTAKYMIVTQGGGYRQPKDVRFQELTGSWTFSSDHITAHFHPMHPFPKGSFISFSIPESVASQKGIPFLNGRDIINFIVASDVSYPTIRHRIDTLSIKNGNRLPLVISIPDDTLIHPVFIHVHGGGWTGGTPTESFAELPTGFGEKYLVEKLGIAVVGVSYRCLGSNGSFTQALEDIGDAISFIKQHKNIYRLDTEKMGIGGESAGAPLASLIAQKDEDISFFIGWNGIYDFVSIGDGVFGHGNHYGQQEPSPKANSAIFQLRDAPPHTLLFHGDADHVIHFQQSMAFDQAIKNRGGKSQLLIYQDQPHWEFYAPGGRYELSVLYHLGEFLRDILE